MSLKLSTPNREPDLVIEKTYKVNRHSVYPHYQYHFYIWIEESILARRKVIIFLDNEERSDILEHIVTLSKPYDLTDNEYYDAIAESIILGQRSFKYKE